MKAVKFKEANKNLTKSESMTDDECNSLWAFIDGNLCISCWKVPFWKRMKMLFYGKIWISVLSGSTQPPWWINVSSTAFVKMKN